MTNVQKSQPTSVPCPDWAATMIEQLRQLEVHLGNIPEHLSWKSQMVAKLSDGIFGEGTKITEEHTEMVFEKICKKLLSEGYAPGKIVEIMNSRVGYEGGPLYCDIDEVEAALD